MKQLFYNDKKVSKQYINTVVEAKEIFKEKGYKKILDVGCGTGENSIYLAESNLDVWACDSNEEKILKTKEKAEKLGLDNIYVYIEDIVNLDYKAEFFDGILCTNLKDKINKNYISEAIRNQFKVLKINGTLIMNFEVGGNPDTSNGVFLNEKEVIDLFSSFRKANIYPVDKDYLKNKFKSFSHEIIVEAIK